MDVKMEEWKSERLESTTQEINQCAPVFSIAQCCSSCMCKCFQELQRQVLSVHTCAVNAFWPLQPSHSAFIQVHASALKVRASPLKVRASVLKVRASALQLCSQSARKCSESARVLLKSSACSWGSAQVFSSLAAAVHSPVLSSHFSCTFVRLQCLVQVPPSPHRSSVSQSQLCTGLEDPAAML